ncbi:hypothetical protein [Methanosaeta sp. UBA356]|jgi:hypothetical protein|uniref:hypothetical protein n=1 Tax=Methanosaeta sp. UBA356 TaxID=1915559 RepID=UPI00257C08CB|nr:hypothetical protein [Methanosaeta sp. UBA356]
MAKDLTKDQAKNLRERKSLRPADRANLDYKMLKKLQSGLDGLAGLLYIMEALPPKKIRPSEERKAGLKDGHVRLLLKLTESALRILNYKKVRGTEEDSYILEEINRKVAGADWITGKSTKHGEFHRRKPKKEEIERAILLWNHVDYLIKEFVDIEHPGIVRNRSIEDLIDEHMWQEEEKKIRELLESGMKDVEQIAKQVGRDSWGVWQTVYQIQENEREIKRRIERQAQDITNLENDPLAIEKIKELWESGWRNRLAIAVEINHSRNAVTNLIDKMIEHEEISKEECGWVSQ